MEKIVYYGMSGSLKMTTIQHRASSLDVIISSDIKEHLNQSRDLFGIIPGDLEFANHRLLILKDRCKLNQRLFIERGISDFLFHHTLQNALPESSINKTIDLEKEILQGERRNILLIMKDPGFIIDKVLMEESRKRRFPTLDDYLIAQESYVKFTKKYNQIDEIIEILDAWKYIKELKLES